VVGRNRRAVHEHRGATRLYAHAIILATEQRDDLIAQQADFNEHRTVLAAQQSGAGHRPHF